MFAVTDAMQKVDRDMSAFEERRGVVKADPQSNSAQPGLAGFTKTLIDAITRLIGYVNEVSHKFLPFRIGSNNYTRTCWQSLNLLANYCQISHE